MVDRGLRSLLANPAYSSASRTIRDLTGIVCTDRVQSLRQSGEIHKGGDFARESLGCRSVPRQMMMTVHTVFSVERKTAHGAVTRTKYPPIVGKVASLLRLRFDPTACLFYFFQSHLVRPQVDIYLLYLLPARESVADWWGSAAQRLAWLSGMPRPLAARAVEFVPPQHLED